SLPQSSDLVCWRRPPALHTFKGFRAVVLGHRHHRTAAVFAGRAAQTSLPRPEPDQAREALMAAIRTPAIPEQLALAAAHAREIGRKRLDAPDRTIKLPHARAAMGAVPCAPRRAFSTRPAHAAPGGSAAHESPCT